ncbi:hypothetical protein C1646_771178 [Rhizophagus diaphanus]|nr:hypothetical protein C1646_771178 [Rhizophagus diaphanus] [Rhizophagus sp. MUCL 43196]
MKGFFLLKLIRPFGHFGTDGRNSQDASKPMKRLKRLNDPWKKLSRTNLTECIYIICTWHQNIAFRKLFHIYLSNKRWIIRSILAFGVIEHNALLDTTCIKDIQTKNTTNDMDIENLIEVMKKDLIITDQCYLQHQDIKEYNDIMQQPMAEIMNMQLALADPIKKGDYKELAAVALKIFGMCVNTASVERMWSSMSFLHTVRRNQLKNEKILTMSQLRASVNFSLREKELQQSQIQFLDSNALPMETDSEVFTPNSNIEEDEEDIEDNTIFIPEHWEQELREWEEMLIEEGLAQLEEEEELRNNTNNNMEGDLLSEYTHPAIDKKAKLELKSLFSSSLNAPNYLNIGPNE